MQPSETNASLKLVNRFVAATYLLVGMIVMASFLGGSSSAVGVTFFAGAIFVTLAVWLVEVSGAHQIIRTWTWMLVLVWWLAVLNSFLRIANDLKTIQLLGDAEMYLGLFLMLPGFPTSLILLVLVFAASTTILGMDYAHYFLGLRRPGTVLIIDSVTLLAGAIIQWEGIAVWRRSRRKRLFDRSLR